MSVIIVEMQTLIMSGEGDCHTSCVSVYEVHTILWNIVIYLSEIS